MRAAWSRSWAGVAALIGAGAAVVLVAVPSLLVPAIAPISGGSGPPLGPLLVAPVGTVWNLTPPSSWCTQVPLAADGSPEPSPTGVGPPPGGYRITCSAAGGAALALDASRPSRLNGVVAVDGPVTVWMVPSAWSCPFLAQLSGVPLPCPPPFGAPSWSSWSHAYNATGALDLGSLPLNLTATPGVIPPAAWTVYLIDPLDANETASVSTAVTLGAA